MHRRIAAVALAMGLSAALVTPAATARTVEPRIYGGVTTSGNPAVVAVLLGQQGRWVGLCSAAMWRPRLLLTAAHCVTASGSSALVDSLAVFPPGAPAVITSGGPQGAAAARPIRWAASAGYVNGAGRVTPNDIAVIQLDSDLGPSGFTRLATHAELAAWTAAQVPVQHLGYGLTGPKQSDSLPHAVELPLLSFAPNGQLGETFSTAQTASAGICPGDSGGPVARIAQAGTFLLGVEVGSNSPCQDPPSPVLSNVSTAAIGYLPFLNGQLAAAGYATIPGAPGGLASSARDRTVTVSWQPPAVAPESVVGYDVLAADGTVVCQSTSTTCAVAGVADGSYSYSVRSRNVDGEGDALGATPEVGVAAPARMSAPRAVAAGRGAAVSVSFATTPTSASAITYIVRDGRGRVMCRVAGVSADGSARTGRLRCTARPGAGTHRFRVIARTSMGATAPSPASRAVVVRG